MHKPSKQQLFVEVPSDLDFLVYCIYYFGCRNLYQNKTSTLITLFGPYIKISKASCYVKSISH